MSSYIDFGQFVRISALAGDLDNDNTVGLSDAVAGLQILTGISPSIFHPEYVTRGIDVNGDNHVGIADIHYILRKAVGLNIN